MPVPGVEEEEGGEVEVGEGSEVVLVTDQEVQVAVGAAMGVDLAGAWYRLFPSFMANIF